MTTTETKVRKPRTVKPVEYRIEKLYQTGNGTEAWTAPDPIEQAPESVLNSADGLRWIRDHGRPDVMYRIVAVKWRGAVSVQKKEVRKLA